MDTESADKRASPAWPITLGVLSLARDIYDVLEASTLSDEKRLEALRTAVLWQMPGPKGLDLACPLYPVAREWIQLREKSLSLDPSPPDRPLPSLDRSHKASVSSSR